MVKNGFYLARSWVALSFDTPCTIDHRIKPMDVNTEEEWRTNVCPCSELLADQTDGIASAHSQQHSISIMSQPPPPPYNDVFVEAPPSYKEMFPRLFRTNSLPSGNELSLVEESDSSCCKPGCTDSCCTDSPTCMDVKSGVLLCLCIIMILLVYVCMYFIDLCSKHKEEVDRQ